MHHTILQQIKWIRKTKICCIRVKFWSKNCKIFYLLLTFHQCHYNKVSKNIFKNLNVRTLTQPKIISLQYNIIEQCCTFSCDNAEQYCHYIVQHLSLTLQQVNDISLCRTRGWVNW